MYFRKDYMGRKGGMASLPSCYFRWDLYSFHNAFDNVTRVPAPPPRPHAQEKESCITVKKGNTNYFSFHLELKRANFEEYCLHK
jgi:hypothetical protein